MKWPIWLINGILLFSLFSASCSNQPSPTAPLQITVATDASVPPFENKNSETQNVEGLDIDIMDSIAARENLKVTYINTPFGLLMTEMAQGKYDAAISAIIITDEHKKDMLFSDPYFAAGQIIVVKVDDSSITGKDNLTGQVGVQSGTNGEIEVRKIGAAVAVTYDKISQAFQDLVTGKLNAVVCDNAVALQYVGNNQDKFKTAGNVFTDEGYGIAVAKGKDDLLSKINNGLKTVKNEGLIDELSQKWLK
jgi:polar amino acid transport system substrate-binding protein